ncbi:MAG: DUF4193 family protein [Actinobacteria bacterium]|nr:MAG: DUF4193 family protein [Actinomycetota bacterium]
MADDFDDDDFVESLEEFDEDAEPDLEEELEDIDPEADLADDLEDDEIVDPLVEEEEDEEAPAARKRRATEDDDEDEELVDPDDVEADLDTILKDRIASGDDDQDDEDEEEAAPEPGADGADRVVPRRADEFVCESCFLVKHASQRVGDSNICRDCV